MNAGRFAQLRRRAIKAGIRRSRKLHHPLSREEALALRIQILPALPRILIAALGVGLITAGWLGWPSGSNTVQGFEVGGGILLVLFALFGIRRTLEGMADSLGHVGIESILDGIFSAFDL